MLLCAPHPTPPRAPSLQVSGPNASPVGGQVGRALVSGSRAASCSPPAGQSPAGRQGSRRGRLPPPPPNKAGPGAAPPAESVGRAGWRLRQVRGWWASGARPPPLSPMGAGVRSPPPPSRLSFSAPAEASGTARSPKCRYPPTLTMVTEAVGVLNERKGSSTAAIKRYIRHNYPGVDPIRLKYYLRKALLKGLEKGYLVRPLHSSAQGATGRFKVGGRPGPVCSQLLAACRGVGGRLCPRPRGLRASSPVPGCPLGLLGGPRGSLRPLPSRLANEQREMPGLARPTQCHGRGHLLPWAWQSPDCNCKGFGEAGGGGSIGAPECPP